jgi:hypothetical protein
MYHKYSPLRRSGIELKMADDNQEPGRRPSKRPRAKLSGHVPVRFSNDVITQLRALADHDGVTVSTWIRQVVSREIERRVPSTSVGRAVEVAWKVDGETLSSRSESTRSDLASAAAAP